MFPSLLWNGRYSRVTPSISVRPARTRAGWTRLFPGVRAPGEALADVVARAAKEAEEAAKEARVPCWGDPVGSSRRATADSARVADSHTRS